MKYEVRDKYNNFLFNTFKSYKEANKFIIDFCHTTKLLSTDEIEIVQILSNEDKDKLCDKIIIQIKNNLADNDLVNIYNHGYRICDHNVIEGYGINELFIKFLIVDSNHEIMLLSYSVEINDSLEIIEYEQIRQDYLV